MTIDTGNWLLDAWLRIGFYVASATILTLITWAVLRAVIEGVERRWRRR